MRTRVVVEVDPGEDGQEGARDGPEVEAGACGHGPKDKADPRGDRSKVAIGAKGHGPCSTTRACQDGRYEHACMCGYGP